MYVYIGVITDNLDTQVHIILHKVKLNVGIISFLNKKKKV